VMSVRVAAAPANGTTTAHARSPSRTVAAVKVGRGAATVSDRPSLFNGEARRPTRLLRAALAAAEAGFFVFPVWPRGKTPAVEDWENTATRDPAQLAEWWAALPSTPSCSSSPSSVRACAQRRSGGSGAVMDGAATALAPTSARAVHATSVSGGRQWMWAPPLTS
jgi:hypothetical protein